MTESVTTGSVTTADHGVPLTNPGEVMTVSAGGAAVYRYVDTRAAVVDKRIVKSYSVRL